MTLKSLSKITRVLLYALMVLVAALMAALFVSADVRAFMENEYGAAGSTVLFYAMLLVCGAIALWILTELAAVLKTVDSDPFVERNAAAFMRMGIAAEDMPRIFEKGFTGYNGRMDKKASGLGLYLCREICRKLGHSIAVESKVNEGTRVAILMQYEKVNQSDLTKM